MYDFSKTPISGYKLPTSGPQGPLTSHPVFFGGRTVNAIPVNITWSAYLPVTGATQFGCRVFFAPQANRTSLIKFSSVYIDNTGNAAPVYVRFPDTNYCIPVAPFAAVFCPAFTNGTIAEIFIRNYNANIPSPITQLFFSDAEYVPINNASIIQTSPQWQASASNNLLPQTATRAPALGDIVEQHTMQLNVQDNFDVFGGPVSADKNPVIYLTGIDIFVWDDSAGTGGNVGVIALQDMTLTNSDVIAAKWFTQPTAIADRGQSVFRQTGFQLLLDGTHAYRIFNENALGAGSTGLVTLWYTISTLQTG